MHLAFTFTHVCLNTLHKYCEKVIIEQLRTKGESLVEVSKDPVQCYRLFAQGQSLVKARDTITRRLINKM